jgi:transcriptional regulator with XRE-family HTH domain/quercetin dioxygenase-like cupin family protein
MKLATNREATTMSEREPPDVGTQVRARRQQQGLSLRALAEICDLSPNTISLIERGASSPSVSTLHRLATALKVPITAFFEDPVDEVELILSRTGRRRYSGTSNVLLESLGSGLVGQTMEPFVVTLGPGQGSGGQVMIHDGHELVYCIQGEVEYEVSEQSYRLGTGDALLFEARLPHRWSNPHDDPTVFLLVMQTTVRDESLEQHLHS